MPDEISRRDFLIQGSAATVGARSGARRRSGLPRNETRSSRVVEVHHPRAVLENRKIDASVSRFLFTPRTLWLGTDPVALDTVSRPLIDSERLRRGLPLLKDTPGFYAGMRPVDHVEQAAAKGVGAADLDRIRIERVLLSA